LIAEEKKVLFMTFTRQQNAEIMPESPGLGLSVEYVSIYFMTRNMKTPSDEILSFV
jgi:hypothetical protein